MPNEALATALQNIAQKLEDTVVQVKDQLDRDDFPGLEASLEDLEELALVLKETVVRVEKALKAG